MDVPQPSAPRTISVTSPAFDDGAAIPARFTCKGPGVSPPFAWSGVPPQAVSLAVVVSDPDAARPSFVHWLVTGLPAHDGRLAEGAAPRGTRQWPNSTGTPDWCPPCPPSGTHRYFFAVHALDAAVDGTTSQQVLAQIGAHTIAWGTLMGLVRH